MDSKGVESNAEKQVPAVDQYARTYAANKQT